MGSEGHGAADAAAVVADGMDTIMGLERAKRKGR
jgi:hypothetical protein